MKLVDVDIVLKFIEDIKCDNNIPKNYGTILDIMRFIRNQPTTYDVDKVIEQLVDKIDPNVDTETGEPCWNWVVDMQNEIIGECIDIVRGGGIDE